MPTIQDRKTYPPMLGLAPRHNHNRLCLIALERKPVNALVIERLVADLTRFMDTVR